MSTEGSSERFYDDLVDYYDLIYQDWNASMARQGDALAGVIREALPHHHHVDASPCVLDVAAGIGTQSLPLAARGFRDTARDISPRAIARLEREAAERGLSIDTGVADMRTVRVTVSTDFDAVICCDNSLPHLLTDEDIVLALSQFRDSLVEGGLCLCSVRDYDRIDRAATRHEYGERRRGDQVFRLWQEWLSIDAALRRHACRRGASGSRSHRAGANHDAVLRRRDSETPRSDGCGRIHGVPPV